MQKRTILSAAIALFLASGAVAREPETLPGTSLDHRVLARPGAVLHDEPGGTAIQAATTFSSFYVFDTQEHDGEAWAEVGANRNGNETAWVRVERTVDWKQTIVLAFTNPAGRLPSMFFEDRPALEAFLQDEAMSTRAELLAQSIEAGQGAADSSVVSIEPPEFVSINDQFYMLPVLEHDSVRVNRRPKRIVKVASINLEEPDPSGPPATPEPFKVGIMFVIDTSTSMQPYIDSTKDAVRNLLSDIQASDAEANFSFGMIGFRSSTEIVPELGYTSKQYHPLTPDFDEDTFLAKLETINATTVSSHDFDEDGLSGLTLAAEAADWNAFDGRYVIHISDAGMLVGTENGAASDATPMQMAQRLNTDHGVASFSLFLKTRAGRAYHDDAIAQLTSLTRTPNASGGRVFAIEDGDVNAFSDAVSGLTESLLESVSLGLSNAAQPPIDICAVNPASIQCAAAEAGYAMQLAWLGRQQQIQAPDTYEAWVADFALDDPRRIALAPRVLLTRAQLNDVYVTLQAIVEAFGQSDQTTPEEFFNVLQSVLARVMRDPSALPVLDASQGTAVANIADFEDLGDLLGDYLQGLPYDSDLGSLTIPTWVSAGPTGRYEFVEGLKGKLSMYELYYADSENWIALNENADLSESVYPIPLEMMP